VHPSQGLVRQQGQQQGQSSGLLTKLAQPQLLLPGQPLLLLLLLMQKT